MFELLDIHPHVEHTVEFSMENNFCPQSSAFSSRLYYQVFARKHGFLPNLSILDLLFNMGPEAIFYLVK